jgi:hypothetical protein
MPNVLLQDVHDLLKPFNPALMRRYEVSSRVNLVKNDDAACAEPFECGCGECLRMASNRLEFAKSNDGLWTPTDFIPLS